MPAYFIFLDEGHLDDAVAVLGHPAGRPLGEGWEHHPVTVDCGADAGKTDDAEASASYGAFTYVVASHYGKKAGPLQVTRQWMARFRQDDLAGRVDDYSVSMQVMRGRFTLHRTRQRRAGRERRRADRRRRADGCRVHRRRPHGR